MSLRGVERVFEVTRQTVMTWLRQWVEGLPRLVETLLPAQHDDVLESDEAWSLVGKKSQKRWLWTVICRRTRQVIAFVIGAAVIFLFMMSSLDLVLGLFQGWAPTLVIDLVQSMSFLVHYDAIVRGVIDVRDLIFYLSIMGVFIYANVVVVDLKKGA